MARGAVVRPVRDPDRRDRLPTEAPVWWEPIGPGWADKFREKFGDFYPCACERRATRVWFYMDPEQYLVPFVASCERRACYPKGVSEVEPALKEMAWES